MRMKRIFISYLIVTPLLVLIMLVMLLMSWTIEKYQLKK
jgi:hypothetical protein